MRHIGFSYYCVLLGLLVCLGWATAVQAAVYRYVDDRGVIHFTNTPADGRWQYLSTSKSAFVDRQRQRSGQKPPREDAYDRVILRAARNHQIEPALVKAVIAAESNFIPTAVSRVGAQGLMQLMPQTARSLGVANPFHPVQNVEGGTRYLRKMLDRYGDMTRALAAYNAGPAAVDRYQGVPPYSETRNYVVRVLNYYRGYNDHFRVRARTGTRKPPARVIRRLAPSDTANQSTVRRLSNERSQ